MTTGEIYQNSVHREISLSLILNQRQWPFFFCSVHFIAGIHNPLQIYNKEWIIIKSIKVSGINISYGEEIINTSNQKSDCLFLEMVSKVRNLMKTW